MSKFLGMLNNWKTTIIGFLPFIVGLLNNFGLIDVTPNDAGEAVNSFFDTLIMFGSSILALIGLFARDADKSSEDSNAV